MHVHVVSAAGEAKFWIEPEIELAKNVKFSEPQLRDVRRLIEGHKDEFIAAWHQHFPG